MKTVLVTLCSALKTSGGESNPPIDKYSIPIIEKVRKSAQPKILNLHPNAVLEKRYRPAYDRYSGPLYGAARKPLLEIARSEGGRVLVASGFYGLLDLRESIFNYELDIDDDVIGVWRDAGLPQAATDLFDELKEYQRLFVLTSRYRELMGESYADGFAVRPTGNFQSGTEYMRFLGKAISHLHLSGRLFEDLSETTDVETTLGESAYTIVRV